ncbi:hypothetical protein BUALT_Bualt12G0044900 [Buddleja alternifolia]|uniref:Uncharacterized protein n=1 Tax=Buddleja alternifolia TaxID=168488 RepID=A0AAV6WTG0_9LAMI|nr:hypothetical protein BUALT_Bualt12G0044900 [Buddleja alternifolia]
MAYNCASALFLIALLFAASNPLANGQLLPNPLPRGITLNGTLCCTATGNCPGQGVAGALVSLNCTVLGATVNLGQATTNANGTFNITVPAVRGIVLGHSVIPCVTAVRLPLNNVACPVLSTANGVLASALESVGTLVTSALGLVQNVRLTGFVNVNI